MDPSLGQRDRWEEIKASEKTKSDFVEVITSVFGACSQAKWIQNLLEHLELTQKKVAKLESDSEKYAEAWGDVHLKYKSLKDELKFERSRLVGACCIATDSEAY